MSPGERPASWCYLLRRPRFVDALDSQTSIALARHFRTVARFRSAGPTAAHDVPKTISRSDDYGRGWWRCGLGGGRSGRPHRPRRLQLGGGGCRRGIAPGSAQGPRECRCSGASGLARRRAVTELDNLPPPGDDRRGGQIAAAQSRRLHAGRSPRRRTTRGRDPARQHRRHALRQPPHQPASPPCGKTCRAFRRRSR